MTSTTPSPPKRSLHIDLETFSDEPLPKCGVYRYAGSPAFEILLTSYAFDNEPVITVDNACGEQMPQELLDALDQRINDRGVRIDRLLVKQAMTVDKLFTEQAFQRAQELTGLENPGSVSQLKAWLADQDMPICKGGRYDPSLGG